MKLLGWISKRPWASGGVVLAGLLAAILTPVVMERARIDRDWVENLAQMPHIEITKDGFSLEPVMDWSYDASGPVGKDVTRFAGAYAELKNAYFVVEPQPGQPYAAHTLILFEFAEDRLVGLTVEARLEKGETYSALDGLFNKFELAYIWATARDLLTRRVSFLKKDIYVYPLALNQEQEQKFLRGVIDRTISVETKPRFYNTLTSNCTNELAKVAGVAWHHSWVLTGYSPQRLFDLKLIPGTDFDAARNLALMTNEIGAWSDLSDADFNRMLLAELRKRSGRS
jgi:hypothetical protein